MPAAARRIRIGHRALSHRALSRSGLDPPYTRRDDQEAHHDAMFGSRDDSRPRTNPRSHARSLSLRASPRVPVASACIGDGDDGDRVPIGSEELNSEEVQECQDGLSGLREEDASLDFGVHRADLNDGVETVHHVRAYIDDCLVLAGEVGGGSSWSFGGFRAGEHTLRVFFDGKEVATEDFVVEPRDVFFAQMNVEDPTALYTAKGNIFDPPADRWRTYLMNMERRTSSSRSSSIPTTSTPRSSRLSRWRRARPSAETSRSAQSTASCSAPNRTAR